MDRGSELYSRFLAGDDAGLEQLITEYKDGLVDGNISKYEMNLQKTGDAYVYELMFICNGVRYTAQIAAADGAVLAYERIVLTEVGRPSAEEGKRPSAEG